MNSKIFACLVALVAMISGCLDNAPKAQSGDDVSVHYTGRFDNGTIFDSSVGQAPLEITLGTGQVIPGFENGIIGMRVGETKNVRMEAVDAYGEVDPSLIVNVSIVNQTAPEIGSIVTLGGGRTAKVLAVYPDMVTIDANYPLAGYPLNFEITLVSIDNR